MIAINHRRSRKLMEGYERPFLITGFRFEVRKVIGGMVVGVVVACRIIVSAPVPVLSSGLWF